jgi:multidrug resistance efflux pump
MGKKMRRTLGLVATAVVILGAVRSFFLWISRTEESQDGYEVFEDEEKTSSK